MKIFTIRLLLVLSFSLFSWAEDSSLSAEELLVIKSAHEKTYPGGRDEEDLEVQASISKPVRKIGANSQKAETPVNDDEF